jgi:hypothetical protein
MNVTDQQLNGPTACEKLNLKGLVAHVGGLAPAFTAAARKEFGELTDTPPVEGASLDAVLPHVAAEGPVEGLFGPAVAFAEDAPALDRIIALSGRDPDSVR